ncbi:hypothetical protein KI387_024874 [Taxus chinensis]|uniref:Uncharacterized protein n=1 Tax=Taxus chinensis TaxID=29808 RepID=A0AA38G4V1_TAXCH|nr:hypothetical protein KI387_024874 [Taxus chinensis]
MAREDSYRPKYWRNIAILHRFNCFSVSQTTDGSNKESANGLEREVSVKTRTKGGWKTMPFIIGNESCEKLGLVGLGSNTLVYLSREYNIKIVTAVNALTIISSTTGIATLGGAFLADSYIGRYLGILIGSLSLLVATSLWTVTALISGLRPSPCTTLQAKLGQCASASKEQLLFLLMVFLFMSIGSIAIRPCALPFAADQFQEEGGTTSKGKKNLQSFFNWYYFSNCATIILASTVIVYLQSNVSWSLGFGVCTILVFISIVIFLVGTPTYRHEIPKGSAFTAIVQVFVASIKKRKLSLPSDPTLLYHGENKSKVVVTNRFRFMNKAAIPTEGDIRADGSVARPWRLSSISLIEELKPVISTLAIFSCSISNSIISGSSFDVFQALTMNRRLGSTSFEVPAASLGVITLITVVIWLPLYDKVLVPLTRRVTKKDRGITPLQRIGIGYVLSTISLVVGGFVEMKRRNAARSHGLTDQPRAVIPISVFWLVPQYVIDGLSDAFGAVGHLDFFYGQFPANMRGFSIAVSALANSMGGYLNTVFITLVHNTTGRNGKPDWLDDNINRGRLHYFYWLLSVMEALNLVYFILCASWYKYRKDPLPQDDSDEIQVEKESDDSKETRIQVEKESDDSKETQIEQHL